MQPVQIPSPSALRNYDMVAVARIACAPCLGCGHGHGSGVALTKGKAVCRNCGFSCTVKAKAKSKRRVPVRRPVVIHDRPTSTPRAREARVRAVGGGRDGAERDDGGGGDSGGGDGDGPPPAHRSDALFSGRAS